MFYSQARDGFLLLLCFFLFYVASADKVFGEDVFENRKEGLVKSHCLFHATMHYDLAEIRDHGLSQDEAMEILYLGLIESHRLDVVNKTHFAIVRSVEFVWGSENSPQDMYEESLSRCLNSYGYDGL